MSVLLGPIIAGLVATIATPQASSVVAYVIAAALMGGAIPAVVGAYRRWKRGPLEDQAIVGRMVRDEMSGMKDLLNEYRVEVEVTKRQLEEYRTQLGLITHELAKAQVRIGDLQEELKDAKRDRDEVKRELNTLLTERDGLVSERDRLAEEATRLAARVEALEAFARRIHPEEASATRAVVEGPSG